MRSILNNVFTIPVDVTSLEPNQNITAVTTDIVTGVIPAGTSIGIYIIDVPTGAPIDLTVTLH